MKPAQPQLPTDLQPIGNLADLIQLDETISEVAAETVNLLGVTAKALAVQQSTLTKVVLNEAKLEKLSLVDVVLAKCDFIATSVSMAAWQRVSFARSQLTGMQASEGTFRDVVFADCKLNLVNFRFSKLINVVFENCALQEADFYQAELKNVSFRNCQLQESEFSAVRLNHVDFRSSELTGIRGVTDLAGATIDSLQLIGLAPVLAQSLKIIVSDKQ